jgi:hypothetical protein
MRLEATIAGAVDRLISLARRVTPGWAAAAGLLVAALLPRGLIEGAPAFCPFRMWSGLPCPGCGLTRSVVALVQGDPAASLHFHPLGAVVVAIFAALVLAEVGGRAYESLRAVRAPSTGEPARGRAASAPSTRVLAWAARGPLPWLVVASLVVVWVVRIPLFVTGAWRI